MNLCLDADFIQGKQEQQTEEYEYSFHMLLLVVHFCFCHLSSGRRGRCKKRKPSVIQITSFFVRMVRLEHWRASVLLST